MAPLVHLAIAQFKPRKGDRAGNLTRLRAVFAQVDRLEPRPTVLCLAESALTGYFLEGAVRDNAVTAGTFAAELDAAYRAAVPDPRPLDVTCGFYEVWNNKLYNSAMYVTLGVGEPRIAHVHRKVFLPTYGLFDEERFVERGRDVRAFDTPWGRAAMLVCEDAWHSMTATIAALDGAQILFVCSPLRRAGSSRSPTTSGPRQREPLGPLIARSRDEHGIYVTLANLVGQRRRQDVPRRFIRGRTARLTFAAERRSGRRDLSITVRPRRRYSRALDLPLVADLETMMPHLRDSLDAAMARAPYALEYDPAAIAAKPATPTKTVASAKRGDGLSVVRIDATDERAPAPLQIDGGLTEQWLVNFVRDEMERRAFRCAVVGISGGVDSAVTAYLAAKALGPENVLGVRMPYRTSSRESLDHAQLVIDALGIQSRTVDISPAVDGYLCNEQDADGGRRGNVMARMRMITLFDLAAKHHGIPLGTGNRPNACSATSPGTPTIRRRSTRSAIYSRRRCGRSRGIWASRA
jgi:predicted amidohydrolase